MKHKWSAGFMAFAHRHGSASGVPPLIVPELTREALLGWFRAHRPGVIVGHVQTMVSWLREDGVRVPADVGFFNPKKRS